MRFLVGLAFLCVGMAFLWTWVADDRGDRWMLGVAISALIAYAVVMAPGHDSEETHG